MTLHVYIDEQFTGDIMGHFNKKRARVMGSEILEDGLIKITAEAPQEEVMNYAVDLRAMTQGQGFFDMEFLGYEFAPEHVAKTCDSKPSTIVVEALRSFFLKFIVIIT